MRKPNWVSLSEYQINCIKCHRVDCDGTNVNHEHLRLEDGTIGVCYNMPNNIIFHQFHRKTAIMERESERDIEVIVPTEKNYHHHHYRRQQQNG